MRLTGAERQRRWRQRQAGKIPPVEVLTCESCGRRHIGAHGALCWRCWEHLTVEGRESRAERVRRARRRMTIYELEGQALADP